MINANDIFSMNCVFKCQDCGEEFRGKCVGTSECPECGNWYRVDRIALSFYVDEQGGKEE